MNRKERRAAFARGEPAAARPVAARLFAEANQAYRNGDFARVEALCRQIEAAAPGHAPGLNLLGLINQARGRHRPAVKLFAQAIAADEFDAACHYNIASSYQLLHERAAAAAHFKKAIAFGLSGQDVGDLLLQNPAVADAVQRAAGAADEGPRTQAIASDDREIDALAKDVFLQCALQSTLICGLRFEFLFTRLRRGLLDIAEKAMADPARTSPDLARFFCALAQQCFINEYVFLQTDDEAARSAQLRQSLRQKLSDGNPVSAFLLAGVAAYHPLHAISGGQSLLDRAWTQDVQELLRQQIAEPLAEAEDRQTIPRLTDIDDATSLEVERQYEENPYPRWTMRAFAGRQPAAPRDAGGIAARSRPDILIAACGTGRHAVDVGQRWPQARILAVDLSRASLAYARKKTREAGLDNIEYAQADILKLGGIGRNFDRIEAVGVLHHLADPKAGWRVLLSLLKPNGSMRIGLYSATARHAIVEARARVAERGYAATVEGIRALRQSIIADPNPRRWQSLLATSADFFCTSGCRDLFFNVMEHRYTLAQIEHDLADLGLSFLGFEVDAATAESFRQRYPGAKAWTNLDHWRAFETAHPDTFRRMYVFEAGPNAGDRSFS